MDEDEEADKEWSFERGPNIFTRIRFYFDLPLRYKPIGASPGRDNMVLTMVLQII